MSRLALGTMTWGRETAPEDAEACLRAFRDAGGTLVDTADRYVDGVAEEILGSMIGDVIARSEIVLSTKAGRPTGPGERNTGSSRDHLLTALEGSLQRLNTDYVDLWQIHAPDLSVPFEETLGALEYAVSSGKARYVGLSNFTGWQTAAMATWQRAVPGRTPLVCNQVSYSLMERGIEREVIPACEKLGLGVLAWSPLARGVLTGKYRGAIPTEDRGGGGALQWYVDGLRSDRNQAILDALITAAVGLDATPLSVALAWVRDRPGVSSVIIGARHADQLAESLSTEGVMLPPAITLALDEVSAPPSGYPETYPPNLL